MSTKLHEIIAVAGDRDAAATAVIDETVTTFQKRPEHFLGKASRYVPFDEADAATAEEASKEIVTTVRDKLTHCFSVVMKAVDVTASRDATNCLAKAAVIIDGKEITGELPATTLLMLESQLKKWNEVMLAIPTLAPGRAWALDPDKGKGVYVDTNPEAKFRTKKVIMSKVLVEATKEHPAQIDKWPEDVKIGKITDTTWSSMVSPAEKSALIGRVQELIAAVKQARQRANCQEVVQVDVAKSLVEFVLG
jgi:hypothetical protein